VRRERFGAADAWGQCAPAAPVRRGRPASNRRRGELSATLSGIVSGSVAAIQE